MPGEPDRAADLQDLLQRMIALRTALTAACISAAHRKVEPSHAELFRALHTVMKDSYPRGTGMEATDGFRIKDNETSYASALAMVGQVCAIARTALQRLDSTPDTGTGDAD